MLSGGHECTETRQSLVRLFGLSDIREVRPAPVQLASTHWIIGIFDKTYVLYVYASRL